MAVMSKHAVVFGASGITGWAIVNELLSESKEARLFSKVTALTNRPISNDRTLWPQSDNLNIVSGIDLLKGSQTDLEDVIKERIADVETTTQVYFNAYKWSANNKQQTRDNMAMLDRSIRAIENLSPVLEYVSLPTGGKTYGFHLLEGFPFGNDLPLSESLPRIPEPYASEMFYYFQVDALEALAKGKRWSWCEYRPDMIVGFVPNNNSHCLAQTLGIYLSLYAHINGPKSKVPFPGNRKSWSILSNEVSQDIVARFSVYASLNPSLSGSGRAFNIADRSRPSSWSSRWPVICSFFDLEGTGPVDGAPQPGAYIKANRFAWDELAESRNLKPDAIDADMMNPGFQHYIMSRFVFNRQMSLDAARGAGFACERDEKETWFTAFERFRKAKIIP